jgi:uncharacterized membrane protein YphA (DoxX/SURF4 family)
MDIWVISLRFALAAVFAAAGVAKLADTETSRLAVSGVGLPSWATPPAALLLPAAEVAVAAGLLAAPGRVTALAAVALMTALNIGLAIRVMRGEKGDCGCFGGARRSPIGWHTVVRNGLLAAGTVLLYASVVH